MIGGMGVDERYIGFVLVLAGMLLLGAVWLYTRKAGKE